MDAGDKKYAFPIDNGTNSISKSRLQSVIPKLNSLSFINIGQVEEVCEVDRDIITLDTYQDEYMAILDQPKNKVEVPGLAKPTTTPSIKSTQAGTSRTKSILERIRTEKVDVLPKKVINIYIPNNPQQVF